METIDFDDATTRFPQPFDQAASGGDVVVSRHGEPLVAVDFDAALPDSVLAGFEGC